MGEVKDKVLREGYDIKLSADNLEADSPNLEQCPHCNFGVVARKAGVVDHCVNCGEVLRNNN